MKLNLTIGLLFKLVGEHKGAFHYLRNAKDRYANFYGKDHAETLYICDLLDLLDED